MVLDQMAFVKHPLLFVCLLDSDKGVQLRQPPQACLYRGGHPEYFPCGEACEPQSLRCLPLLPEWTGQSAARCKEKIESYITSDRMSGKSFRRLSLSDFPLSTFPGFLKEGCELINEALNLFNNVYGAMHVEICACLRLLARLNYIMGDHPEVGSNMVTTLTLCVSLIICC